MNQLEVIKCLKEELFLLIFLYFSFDLKVMSEINARFDNIIKNIQ